LSERGIKAVPFHCFGSATDNADDADSQADDRCCNTELPDEPSAVLVNDRALTECLRHLHSHVLFLAVPTYFHKSLAQAIRSLSQNGNAGDGRRITIYDYVDNRVGLLENYFRMRSYNYGVHPDVLLASSMN
jgi:hypothetical protein